MIKSMMNILKRFYIYQNERFPIVLLSLSLFPVVLSSAAVMSKFMLTNIFLSFFVSLAYIFHIRVNDEYRDFEHDTKHHSTRPLQRGVITLHDLKLINVFAIFVVAFTAIFYGTEAIFIAIIMILYSYFAKYDFFCKEKIRKHFYIYNFVHIIQIFLLQIFVYIIVAHKIQFTEILFFHFLFTLTGTIIFEFARKLKIPGEDGTGTDTYTYYLGFNKSMIFYSIFIFLNVILFSLIYNMIHPAISLRLYFFLSLIIFGLSILLHWVKKMSVTDKLMQGIFLLIYAIYNVSIFVIMY